MSDPADLGLRASDADREATAQRLHTAATEGRLDAEELDERLTAVYAARYCSELAPLTADVTPSAPAPAAPPAPLRFVRPTPFTNGFAIAALVSALVWFAWFGSVLAVIFGHVALGQIERSGGRQRGKGLAIAGLALGYFEIFVFAAVLVASLF